MKKYYIITLLILLSCNVLAQEDYSFTVQKNRPVETVEPDVLSTQPYNEQSSEETEDILVSPPSTSSPHATQVAESRNQVVLLIGDSMADGMGTRFNDYAVKNGFEFHSIVWYGSTTRDWAIASDLQYYNRRTAAIQTILSRVVNIPYVWVGPLPWRKVKDRRIVNVIRDCTGEGKFFDSSSVIASRADGVHPTRQGAAHWVDKIVEWMGEPELNDNPIEMDQPDFTTCYRHDEKHGMGYHGRR